MKPDLLPCGACRQVLAEFGQELLIVTADEAGLPRLRVLASLLPEAFHLSHP
jgi:cytidine deaminase